MKVLIATHNPGKKREYAALFDDPRVELTTLTEQGIAQDVEETGATFAENALLKARHYAQMTGLLTLADDSGLEVDALGGAPGVYSARYGEKGFTDADRYRLLLHNLEGVPDERRSARFRCVIALVWPDGRVETAEGACEGRIAHTPAGEHGFGYDPVFYLPDRGCTLAETPPEVKNRISHRAQAAHAAWEILRRELV